MRLLAPLSFWVIFCFSGPMSDYPGSGLQLQRFYVNAAAFGMQKVKFSWIKKSNFTDQIPINGCLV